MQYPNWTGSERIYVQTFDKSVPQGRAARRLYLDFGFADHHPGGPNPAGIDTVVMKLEKKRPETVAPS